MRSAVLVDVRPVLTFAMDTFVLARAELNVASDIPPLPPVEVIVILSVDGLAARVIPEPATNVRVSPLLSAKMLFAPTVILENVFVEYLASALAT